MKTSLNFTAITFTLGIMLSWPVFANEPTLAYANTQSGVVTGQRYTHPTKQFAITVPQNAEIIEREAPVDVSIRSRAGWVMHIQSGPVNPTATLEDMAARLEARYLGPNRAWTAKLLGGPTEVAGLPAYQSLYQGSGSRSRVVIIRTQALDMALMFIAPDNTFTVDEQIFSAMLSGFQPPQISQAPRSSGVASPQTGGGMFRNDAMGVSMAYPSGWMPEQPAAHMVVFTRHGQSDGAANASIQNIQSPMSEPGIAAVEGVLQEIMAQLAYSVSNVQHSRTEPIQVAVADHDRVEGRQLVSDYARFDTPFRQWSIALPRHDSNIVHVFTFVAPRDSFELIRQDAERMVQSWTLTPVAR